MAPQPGEEQVPQPPPLPNGGGAFDPAMLEWLMQPQPQVPTGPSYDSDILKDQGKYLTQQSKFSNTGTDMDYLLQSGMLAPGAFQPNEIREAANAPGYRQTQQWATGSPFQQFVAQAFAQNQDAASIMTELQKLAADAVAGDQNAADIVNSLPKQYVGGQGEPYMVTDEPDMQAAMTQITGLENARNADPEYQVDEQGNAFSTTFEDSAASQAAQDAGYINDPTATYDPYDFAPGGTTFESDQAKYNAVKEPYADFLASDVAARDAQSQARSDANSMAQFLAGWGTENTGPQQNAATPQQGAAPQELGVPDFQPSYDIAPDEDAGFEQASQSQGSTAPNGIRGQTGSIWGNPEALLRERSQQIRGGGLDQGARSAGRGAAQGAMQQRMDDSGRDSRFANLDRRGASKDFRQSQYESSLAEQKHMMRQAMADQLLSQRRSPFHDERNARNRQIYGPYG